jgi:hypothetical protein
MESRKGVFLYFISSFAEMRFLKQKSLGEEIERRKLANKWGKIEMGEN